MYDKVKACILEMLQRHGCDTNGYGDNTPVSQIPIDSLGLIELIAEIEDHFQILVPQAVQSDLRTIGDLVDEVVKKVQHSSARREHRFPGEKA